MGLIISFFINVVFAQEIRLRLLQHQVSIPIVAESIEWNGNKAQSLTINYAPKTKVWLIHNGRTQELSSLAAPKLELEAVKAIIHGRKVTGKFYLVWNEKNRSIDLIYPMDIDKYLIGVVPAEMPSSWPMEALKAQVVASRSYVLVQMQNQASKHFDVDSSVMDQVFNKKKFESLPVALQEKVKLAISQTQGEVLFKDKKIFKTYFHSRCGGHTEDPRTVWRGTWKWDGKKDPYCDMGSAQNWSYTLQLEDLAHFYASESGEELGKITKILSGKKTESGRSDHVFLFFEDGRIRRWSTQDMRQEVGFSNIKSTLFDIVLSKETVSFRGKGFGHGVGLCQYGARQMASLGKKHNEILEFYYSTSQLRRVFHWPSFIAKLQGNTL